MAFVKKQYAIVEAFVGINQNIALRPPKKRCLHIQILTKKHRCGKGEKTKNFPFVAKYQK